LSRPSKAEPAVKPAQTEPVNPSKRGPLPEPSPLKAEIPESRNSGKVRFVFDVPPDAEVWYASEDRTWKSLGKVTEWLVADPGDSGAEWDWSYRFASQQDRRWLVTTGKWRGERTLVVRFK